MNATWSRAWSADVGGDITCPPVVTARGVFVRAGRRIISMAGGAEDWSRMVGLGLGRGEGVVAVAGGIAADDVADGHTTVVAFDLDGQARWRNELDGVTADAGCTPGGETVWWLVVDAGRPRLHVMDAMSGEAWSTSVPPGSSAAVASTGSVFVAASSVAGAVPGLVMVDLDRRERRRLGGDGVDNIVASEGRVFTVGSQDEVTCHDAATGASLWKRPGFGLSMAADEGRLSSFSEDERAWILVDGDTGERTWTLPIEPLEVYGVALGEVALLVDVLEIVVADPLQGHRLCTLDADREMITQASQAGLGPGVFVAAAGRSAVAWSAP